MAGLPFESIFQEVVEGQRLFSYEPHNSTFYNVSGIARLVGTVWFLGFSVVFLAFYLNTKLNANPPSNGSPSDEGGRGAKLTTLIITPTTMRRTIITNTVSTITSRTLLPLRASGEMNWEQGNGNSYFFKSLRHILFGWEATQ